MASSKRKTAPEGSYRKKRKPKQSRRKPKMAKKKRSGSRTRAVHVIPDAMILGGILLPAFETSVSGGQSGVSSLAENAPANIRVRDSIHNLKESYTDPTLLVDAAELVVAGVVVKWLGKKTGLNRFGTKEFKAV